MVEIGDRWHRGKLSITREHYATAYLMQRLAVLMRSSPNSNKGALIWVGCAPSEHHEIGAILLTLYFAPCGLSKCVFIGKDLLKEDFCARGARATASAVLFECQYPRNGL
ncbi:MAG: hypothetical protein HC936_16000 [Leptolyngbyaceae cyanobacterium SU_3_3]|nr:hypothetical protein [Leptolyngbyaceae cyanobacterium SU_3_3]